MTDPTFRPPSGHGRRGLRHPSDACGLGRAADPTTPALQEAKRLRFAGHREVCAKKAAQTSAPLPRSGVSATAYARPQKTTPEGEDAGTGPADLSGSERDQIMASKKTTPTSAAPAARTQPARPTITLELVIAHAPHAGLVENLARTFGLNPVDYAAIRDSTEEHVALGAKALETTLNEKAMQIHLQRIVGAYVSSAYGAAQFYGNKVSDARRLTMPSENDDRDEDRGGMAGFESKGERARLFAAEMGLQSFALLAAAEGAVSAYAHITGDEWKPYEAPSAPASNVQRRSAQAEMAAFGS